MGDELNFPGNPNPRFNALDTCSRPRGAGAEYVVVATAFLRRAALVRIASEFVNEFSVRRESKGSNSKMGRELDREPIRSQSDLFENVGRSAEI